MQQKFSFSCYDVSFIELRFRKKKNFEDNSIDRNITKFSLKSDNQIWVSWSVWKIFEKKKNK